MNKTLYIDKFIFWHETDNESLPDVSFIPPMLRRRMSMLEKIAIALASRIIPENSDYITVFASRFGEWNQTIKLIKQFYTDREMSPAGFSNSVHNAMPGHFSLLTHNKNTYTSIAAGEKTIEMAMLDAITGKKPVLLVYAEERSPSEYDKAFNKPVYAHGFAMFLSDTGEKAYELDNTNNDSVLDFNTLEKALNSNTDIKASKWTLVKKQ